MAYKVIVTTQLVDENGNPVTENKVIEKDVPDFDTFDEGARRNFKETFSTLEKPAVNLMKDVSETVVSSYMETLGEKKKQKETGSGSSSSNPKPDSSSAT